LECGGFTSEIAIHFPGLDGLKKPIVWVFPNLGVCFGCGSVQFVVPEKELKVLFDGKPVEGAFASMKLSASAVGKRPSPEGG